MQSEFNASQVAIHDLLNELEARVWTNKKMFQLNKYIIEMAKVQYVRRRLSKTLEELNQLSLE